MKDIVKLMGLFVLIGFSFFYTDKILEVVREEDKLMIELSNLENTYKEDAINGVITKDTIIPGIEGRILNIDNSYNKMKINGVLDTSLLVFDYIKPSISLENNKDKFIIKGNSNKNMISIIIILNNDKYFNNVNDIVLTKEIDINYFVSYNYLINNSNLLKDSIGEFYSYGDEGIYTVDNLLFSNNLLTRIRGVPTKYCLSKTKDKKVLNMCSKYNLYTVVPNIIGDTNLYSNVKNNLESGSIISINLNNDNLKELSTVIDYIKGKGYKIVGLSELLSEKIV